MKLQQLMMFQGPGLTGLRHSLMVPKPSVNSDFFSVLSENGGWPLLECDLGFFTAWSWSL